MRVGVSSRSNSGCPSSWSSALAPADRDQLADQRIAVGVRAGGGQADDGIAGAAPCEPSMIASRLDDADAEAGEVVVVAVIHAGHLGGLAADQRAPACTQPSAMPRDHAGGDVHLQLAGGVVVEEEQRLGALHDDVVGAHGDQVDADACRGGRCRWRGAAWCRRRRCRRPAPARGSAAASSTSAPKPPMPASTSGRCVRRTSGLMRSTSSSPASMSTPASR